MINQRFFDNPYFLAYARLLHQLHVLIREGADETPEAELLREQMDEPAKYLAQEEIDCLNAISADFYTLSGQPWQVQPSPPMAREELKEALEARDRRDYVKALDLLRKNQVFRETASVSYMRARIWSGAGEYDIALDFFRRAKELTPRRGTIISCGWTHSGGASPANL
jgi:tetratricopeptide (TPR) repeat protein